MFIGPVFHRELTIAPRRKAMYVARTAYAGILLLLMSTAFLILTGTQHVRDIGDLARFGMVLFQILAPLQLALVMFCSALVAASAVAQEKDRRTLILLLLTNLTNSELVFGKLLASVLNIIVLLLAAVPLFMLSTLFGGVSAAQVARVFAVTLVAALACGSLGSLLALWREKTFQALAMTVLVLVLWLAVWEIVASEALGAGWLGISAPTWAAGFSPWQAILEATRPYPEVDKALGPLRTPVNFFLLIGGSIVVLLNAVAVGMVRVWNPSRETHRMVREDETWNRQSIWGAEYDVAQQKDRSAGSAAAPGAVREKRRSRAREVWDNPVIWREMRTWAYGRRILVIRFAYLLLFALAAASLYWMAEGGQPMTRQAGAIALVPLFLLSLVLVNAQAVTSLTSERDVRALDLILVSDLTPKEIVFGKLGGVFYNTKEMVLLPIGLCFYLWYVGAMGMENMVYLVGGLAVLYLFVAMLGIHAGMTYPNSRSAIGTSLGTVFFLFMGVAVCMRMMVAFSGSFQAQLQPFLAFMLGGGIGLYVALGARNPSAAVGVASFLCPFATFYAITSFFLDYTLGVFLVTAAAYGFTTAAMMVPAIYEFDVATGRTTIGEQ
ncbi:MAG: ABC transporter permease [Rhodopirellula sp.]|nr:ABC transporter permease [Rhodopirellula sp.]